MARAAHRSVSEALIVCGCVLDECRPNKSGKAPSCDARNFQSAHVLRSILGMCITGTARDDMDDFGSAQWIEERQRRVAELEVASELTLTIEHRVVGDDAETWHVEIEGGQITFRIGPHPNPTLTLTGSRSTTDAIRSGEQSAQRAFLNGELRVGGNVATLLDNHIQLEKLAALLAATI